MNQFESGEVEWEMGRRATHLSMEAVGYKSLRPSFKTVSHESKTFHQKRPRSLRILRKFSDLR